MKIVQKLSEALCTLLVYFYADDDDLAELMLIFWSLPQQGRA
ncbi:hypothetical protein [Citrobacter amalonaticus]